MPEAHGVISVYTHFDRKTLEGMKKCRIIATQTIGTNTIDLDAATEFGICVTNVPDYCIEEVALHTVTLAMACVRKIRVYDMLARSKNGILKIFTRKAQLTACKEEDTAWSLSGTLLNVWLN